MEVHDRLRILTRASARRTLSQPAPLLRQQTPSDVTPEQGNDQPLTNLPAPDTGGCENGSSLLHLLDLRRRYREEAVSMRSRLVALQATLEDCSRQLWYQLTAGQATASKLRAHCDDLVEAVEAAERDLADAHLAIEGVGHEITMLVATRQRKE